MEHILPSILTLLLGIAAGVGITFIIGYLRGNTLAKKANKMIEDAKKEAEKQKRDRILELKEEGYKLKQETEKEVKEKKEELKATEERLLQRENNLDKRDEMLQKREFSLEEKENHLLENQKALQAKSEKMDEMLKDEMERLEKIAHFSKEKAHDLIMQRTEEEMASEIASYMKEKEHEAKLNAAEQAKNLIVESMQRYSEDVATEQTVSTIDLPNDEMKGRLIGREGRNIRTIEHQSDPDRSDAQICLFMLSSPLFCLIKAARDFLRQLRIRIGYPRDPVHLLIYQCKGLAFVDIQSLE